MGGLFKVSNSFDDHDGIEIIWKQAIIRRKLVPGDNSMPSLHGRLIPWLNVPQDNSMA